MIRMFWLVALVAALGFAPTAQAQVRAAHDLPVTVRLEIAPDPPLRVSGAELSFGTVRIPNRLKLGTVCTYNMTANGAMQILDSSSPGQASTTVTPSGCQQTQAGSIGVIGISCDPGRNVRIAITQVPGRTPNLTFNMGQTVSSSMGVNAGSGSERCNSNGSTGLIQVRVGGTLSVGQDYTLPTAQAIQVAHLAVSVEYF